MPVTVRMRGTVMGPAPLVVEDLAATAALAVVLPLALEAGVPAVLA